MTGAGHGAGGHGHRKDVRIGLLRQLPDEEEVIRDPYRLDEFNPVPRRNGVFY